MFVQATHSNNTTRPFSTHRTGSFPRSELSGQVGHTPRTLQTRPFISGRGHSSGIEGEGLGIDAADRSRRLTARRRHCSERRFLPQSRQVGFYGALVVVLMTLALSFDALKQDRIAHEVDHRSEAVVEQTDRAVQPISADLASAEAPPSHK